MPHRESDSTDYTNTHHQAASSKLQSDAPLHAVQVPSVTSKDACELHLPNCYFADKSQPTEAKAQELRVGMAWNGADNVNGEKPSQTAAMHDFVFAGPKAFGLQSEGPYEGLVTRFTPESVQRAQDNHKKLVEQNPQIQTLAEVRYRDAPANYLPKDSKWWLSEDGKAQAGYAGKGLNYRMLDIRNPEFQKQVADQAAALVKSGVVNGVMFDWFNDGDEKKRPDAASWDAAKLEMLTKVRAAIGKDAKIFINTNSEQMPDAVAKLVNGYYLECNESATPEHWSKIGTAVDKAREQGKNVFVETWPDNGKGREQENKMRATMTLMMTHAPDGYALFADADGTNKQEHMHDWYQFYDTKIGKPSGALTLQDGASRREYENGTVIYNPMGNKLVPVTFPEERTSAASGVKSRTFLVRPEDGDIFLK